MPGQAQITELTTARTRLRAWRPADRALFAELNRDPLVMEHFPSVLSEAASDRLADRIEARLAEQGWGLWAVELRATGEFCGFVGLNQAHFPAPFTPAVEVGWRLAPAHWGRGYASEAGLAALGYGFTALELGEIVAFTTTANHRSRQVMARLGMRHDPADDFDHPGIPPGHPQRRHVLYRLSRSEWTTGLGPRSSGRADGRRQLPPDPSPG
ncbi:MAG TPA: GNAT family N-acetyltransferase [Candidatus Dormibacteraeota bacterium]